MSEPGNAIRAHQPDPKYHHLRMLGTGAGIPTIEVGHGMTLSRTAQGVIKVTWNDNPGVFLGVAGYMFGDTTPADVKGYSISRDTISAASSTADAYLELSFWDSSFAAVDLSTTSYLDITFAFARST